LASASSTISKAEAGRPFGHPASTATRLSRGPRLSSHSRDWDSGDNASARLEVAGLTVESTPGHYRVLRDGKPLRKANGMPFMLPFSPDTIRWRRAAIVDLRKLGIHL
jgi:hypothetical protein